MTSIPTSSPISKKATQVLVTELITRPLPAEPGALRRGIFVGEKQLQSASVDATALALIAHHTDTSSGEVAGELEQALRDLMGLTLANVRLFGPFPDPFTSGLAWGWGIFRRGEELTAAVVYYNTFTGEIGPDDSPSWIGKAFVDYMLRQEQKPA